MTLYYKKLGLKRGIEIHLHSLLKKAGENMCYLRPSLIIGSIALNNAR